MFENVFKILKITKKNFAHFFNKGGGGGVQISFSRKLQVMLGYVGLNGVRAVHSAGTIKYFVTLYLGWVNLLWVRLFRVRLGYRH